MSIEIYKSELTKDEFMIHSIDQVKFAYVIQLNVIDDILENLGLLGRIIDDLNEKNITKLLYKYNKKCDYPKNIKFGRVVIDNELYTIFTFQQFKRFYTDNIGNIVNRNIIAINTHKNEDGWTVVDDSNKQKIRKIKEIQQIIGDLVH
jgi:hypothetical protein